jgi:hypothetical protein
MKQIIYLLICCLLGANIAKAQTYARIKVDQVTVKAADQQLTGSGVIIPLQLRDKTDAVTLFSNSDLTITVRYKLIDMKSGRSDNKASGIRFKIDYTCTYKGKTQRRSVERMFFINDKRVFDEKDAFVFNNKISNTKIAFSYTGMLEE